MKDAYHETIYSVERTHWWYRVRRLIVHNLIARYASKRQLKILDVGCGTGTLLGELSRYGEAQGVDISPKAVAFCQERGMANARTGNVTAIGFPDNSFDVVLALDILEHVADDVGAIAEIRRVLKPGGLAIVFVPAFMSLWGSTDLLSEHYRRYRLPELREKLGAGFTVLWSSYFNTFLFAPIALWRLANRITKLHSASEMELNNPFINTMLFAIFFSESKVACVTKMPFGVSAMVVSRKSEQ